MPPSSPARQRQPTLSTLFASPTRKRKAAELPFSTASRSPPVNSVHYSAPSLAPSSVVPTSDRGQEAPLSGERAEAPAGAMQQHSTAKASSCCGSGSDSDEGADMLLGELLFGTDTRHGADWSSGGRSPPAAPPALLDIAAPVSAAAAAAGAHPPRLRSRRPPSHLTQTTLDLGQAGLTVGTRCPLCRMLYTAEDDEDAALHRRFCRGKKRLRRLGRGPCDAASSFAAASCSRRVRSEAPAKPLASRAHTAAVAVRMLEELSGTNVGHSLSSLQSNTTTTSQHRGQRRRGIGSCGAVKATRTATDMPNDGAGGPVCVCACVSCPLPSPSSPLAAFHFSYDACELADGEGAGTVLSLLELLNFTPVVLRAAAEGIAARQAALSPVLSGSVFDVPRAQDSVARTVHVVCVVDVVLRQLLCAVIGEPRRREQDPELRVERRADGTAVCRTHRHFTYGDVAGLWLCSPVELSAAREVWEKRAAAPFASTRQALENFFGTHARGAAPSSGQSHAAHITGRARERCQEAAGVALHTLAQHLVYGNSLCPLRHLSYAQASLTPAVASLGVRFVEQSLAAVSSCYPAVVTPKPREDVAEPQSLYVHDDVNSGRDSDSDNANEGGVEVHGE
ncbi:hypothetical protein CUR178_08355 [Leishmania enriettii]|uniref:N-acetyltransferase ESCO zinc-finger domain-containing protein n=1 Tax=Leishmania enriettii TaxID=5663 RepID=A0A836I2Q7_LEIEN|nr:hypothetical protein CUR178_08355 [Leishmania enriettii]